MNITANENIRRASWLKKNGFYTIRITKNRWRDSKRRRYDLRKTTGLYREQRVQSLSNPLQGSLERLTLPITPRCWTQWGIPNRKIRVGKRKGKQRKLWCLDWSFQKKWEGSFRFGSFQLAKTPKETKMWDNIDQKMADPLSPSSRLSSLPSLIPHLHALPMLTDRERS